MIVHLHPFLYVTLGIVALCLVHGFAKAVFCGRQNPYKQRQSN